MKCSYDGTVTLDARSRGYIVTRLVPGNHGYTQSYTYPLTSGILTAPVEDVTSGLFNGPYNQSGGFSMPNGSSGAGFNFDWLIDVEVTVMPPSGPAYAAFMSSM